MNEIEIDELHTPTLDDPVFIEGLPGIGLVGKLAVDHLIAELDAEPVRRVYSEHFPPAVSVENDGTAELPSLTLHAVDAGTRDLLVLGGDTQAQEAIGQYRVAAATLDILESFGPEELITLGGFGTGEEIDEYHVVGAVSEGNPDLRERLADAGVAFERENAPGNIVGMSGLLVGLGGRRNFATAGLLGLTPGYHVDPASARAVLDVLQEAFGFSVSLETLDEQAEKVEQLIEQVQQAQQRAQEPTTGQGGEDLRYFG